MNCTSSTQGVEGGVLISCIDYFCSEGGGVNVVRFIFILMALITGTLS